MLAYADPVRQQYVEARRQAVPAVIRFPEELPISAAREQIAAAIRDHQVIVVAGETGSGKTTQLPKICLELGRGITGMIGHTQPRRLAARTVAERIADELGVDLGDAVGYQVRFTDRISPATSIKLMTDGILLTELQRDKLLRRYDTLIIDEAHERSLNIDFILGYLRRLLPRRPDLKVIITSATIDPQRFADHFTLPGAEPVPVLEVSGRTYPVEVRYRPVEAAGAAEEQQDTTDAICAAVDELWREREGDVLVFLSGEREIRDTADALAATVVKRWRHTEIVPLYARLSNAEQHRVFAARPQGILRRVVLATNVAETSLTVPGIRFVVDPGTARISRYSFRTKVQRLPIEAISQASANQRAGRCGRVAEGICIRLYSEEDYASRPAFTDPEILRTNLASVILQMAAIGLGDVAAFPFVDAPDKRSVADGVALLTELHALEPRDGGGQRLTDLGRRVAQLPVDPRLARMILEADRNGCVHEVIVIAAALSIQDPRERPQEAQQAADESHRRFADPTSDFLTYLNLWNYLREQADALSSNQFRRMCRREFLGYLRVREWQDLVGQLRQIARGVGITVPRRSEGGEGSEGSEGAAADPDAVHRSLLAGLLSHLGVREERSDTGGRSGRHEFTGARGAKFLIWPGSALARKPPGWVMAGELVETSRLWGRDVAAIQPEWVEPLAAHLIKRTYSEPHWSSKRSAAMAYEKVTLYGVPIVSQRLVGYSRIDPELSRELFIRHALVEGDWRTHHRFFHANRELLDDVEDLEHRARRRDILVDDETLFAFYDTRIPADVTSGRHFDAWWKKARRTEPELLTFTEDLLVSDDAAAVHAADYPNHWSVEGGVLTLSYQFEPGTASDGVTVHVPVQLLAGLDAEPFSWQVPGLREELVTALIRSLPKAIRTNFVPAPDTARAALSAIAPAAEPPEGSLLAALEHDLGRRAGLVIPPHAWDLDKVPAHLRMTFRVLAEGDQGAEPTVLAEGKDLPELQNRLRQKVKAAVAAIAGAGVERSRLTTWDVGELPRTVEREAGGRTVSGFPALVDEGDGAAVRVLPTAAEQAAAMRAGTRRLLIENLANPLARLQGQVDYVLPQADRLALAASPYPNTAALLTDCLDTAIDDLVTRHGGPAWDGEAFAALLAAVRGGLDQAGLDVVRIVARVLTAWREVDRAVAGTKSLPLLPMLTDVRDQTKSLINNGFVAEVGASRLPDLVRYLRGIAHRLAKAPENVNADRGRMDRVRAMQDEYVAVLDELPPSRRHEADVHAVRWMLEEFRLSLFAQNVGTAYPISEQRILKALDAL
ncbi:MAG: ATP-dependent RNA helicase HrpA [Kineosporiaceae bacterium]|nr:ATP-dependent RNA helicase HrpA [Kineosporiaceae bacterium]